MEYRDLESCFLSILLILMGVIAKTYGDEKEFGSMVKLWYLPVLVGLLQIIYYLFVPR